MAKEYLDIFDRFDGGGAGQMGDRFAGGGILSMIANEFFTPYGSEDDDRKRRLLEMRGLFDALEAETTAPRPKVTRGGGTGRTQVRPQARPSQSMPFGITPVGGGMPAAPGMTFGNVPVGGGMPAAQNYESSLAQMLQMYKGPVDYRSQHVSEAVSDAYDREMALAETLRISPEEADARYYAQKHMAYSDQPMSQLTDPSAGGIPNIDRLMPPVNGAPQAPQGIPVQPYQAKPVPPALQLDPIPRYAETLDRMKKELGEEKYRQILMSPNFTQILEIYARGGPVR